MSYRVLVTGSRNWKMRSPIWIELHRLAVEHGFDGFIVVHGAAEGADQIAQEWAVRHSHDHIGVINEPHPAQWRFGRGGYNPQAGAQRNEHMVNLGANICLAFAARCRKPGCIHGPAAHYSHGVQHCAALATVAGIPVVWKKVPLR